MDDHITAFSARHLTGSRAVRTFSAATATDTSRKDGEISRRVPERPSAIFDYISNLVPTRFATPITCGSGSRERKSATIRG